MWQLPLAFVALGRIYSTSTPETMISLSEFQRATGPQRENAEALGGIAMSYQNAGRIPEAETAFLKSAALRPDDWSGYNVLGIFYGVVGRQKEAIKQYRKAISLTPDKAHAPDLNLGNALLNSGEVGALPEAEMPPFEKSYGSVRATWPTPSWLLVRPIFSVPVFTTQWWHANRR